MKESTRHIVLSSSSEICNALDSLDDVLSYLNIDYEDFEDLENIREIIAFNIECIKEAITIDRLT